MMLTYGDKLYTIIFGLYGNDCINIRTVWRGTDPWIVETWAITVIAPYLPR
jgi:hypothetical protein